MPEVWAVIVGAIVLLIIYAIVSSKVREGARRKQREKSLPFVDASLVPGVDYNVYLTDGRKFMGVQLVGTSDAKSGQFSIGGWEDMLVIRQSNGKRVFVRPGSVRCIEEV